MALKLMYITNQPDVAKIAQASGVDRIFVDMEYIGKDARQGGMDTVQCHHTYEDIIAVRKAVTRSELLVRVNPIHNETDQYCSSKEEIDRVIACGADIIMLPYFKTCDEVEGFISYVDGRARTMLLLETPEACAVLDRIISLNGIDFVHIGINDLSLGYGYKFMFHLLADGTVEKLCQKLSASHIPYGFGGIASLGRGMLPAERIIMEHYRLGSEMAILSRSFCDTSKVSDLSVLSAHFSKEVSRIREYEAYCIERCDLWEQNRSEVVRIVDAICSKI